MKRVYLIRHAKSSWKSDAPSDFERPLSARGKREAPMMAKLLHERGVVPDLILSSSAKRAKKTAKIFAKILGVPKDRIHYDHELYGASPDTLLSRIKATDDAIETLFVVAHNPGLTELANRLSPLFIDNLPTSAIFGVAFDVEHWEQIAPGSGRVVLFEFPKKYREVH